MYGDMTVVFWTSKSSALHEAVADQLLGTYEEDDAD